MIRIISSSLIGAIWFHFIGLLSLLYFYIFCNGKVYNLKNVENEFDKGFILAPNHTSYFDWLILYAIFLYKYKLKIIFFAKKKLFKHPVFCILMHRANCICVNGNDGMNKDFIKSIRKNKYLAIFPEGTRSRTGELVELKSGIIKVSAITMRPIIPVALCGFYRAWPPHNKFPRINKCHIIFGDPYIPAVSTRKDLTEELIADELSSLKVKLSKLLITNP